MILPDVNVLIYAFRTDNDHHAVCRAWLEAVVRCPLRHRAAGAERLRAHHDRPPHLYESEPAGGAVPLLRHASWPASLSDRRARRASLGPLPAPLPRDQHARLAGHRRLVRRACDRMGLRVGDDGPRLCTVPGPEMGDARHEAASLKAMRPRAAPPRA